jgi:glutamate racemase
MIVVDSGLGGISVVRALRATQPHLPLTYLADTAGFPYGSRTQESMLARGRLLIEHALKHGLHGPFVLACNTLSTLCLGDLREQFNQTFVGTVPAIKTAAQWSKSRRITLLATPNTAQSSYTQDLISEFAADCVVDIYGAPNLAALCESALLGEPISDAQLRQEIAPAFSNDTLGRTDILVLGCTHYPLLLDRLEPLAPWPVRWMDASDAIARRALSLADKPPAQSVAYVTSAAALAHYQPVFAREGFLATELLEMGSA